MKQKESIINNNDLKKLIKLRDDDCNEYDIRYYNEK